MLFILILATNILSGDNEGQLQTLEDIDDLNKEEKQALDKEIKISIIDNNSLDNTPYTFKILQPERQLFNLDYLVPVKIDKQTTKREISFSIFPLLSTNKKDLNKIKDTQPLLEKKNPIFIITTEIIDKSIKDNKDITIKHDFICYDFLDLRNKNELIKILTDYSEDVTEFEIFSFTITLTSFTNKKIKRILFITSK